MEGIGGRPLLITASDEKALSYHTYVPSPTLRFVLQMFPYTLTSTAITESDILAMATFYIPARPVGVGLCGEGVWGRWGGMRVRDGSKCVRGEGPILYWFIYDHCFHKMASMGFKTSESRLPSISDLTCKIPYTLISHHSLRIHLPQPPTPSDHPHTHLFFTDLQLYNLGQLLDPGLLLHFPWPRSTVPRGPTVKGDVVLRCWPSPDYGCD